MIADDIEQTQDAVCVRVFISFSHRITVRERVKENKKLKHSSSNYYARERQRARGEITVPCEANRLEAALKKWYASETMKETPVLHWHSERAKCLHNSKQQQSNVIKRYFM